MIYPLAHKKVYQNKLGWYSKFYIVDQIINVGHESLSGYNGKTNWNYIKVVKSFLISQFGKSCHYFTRWNSHKKEKIPKANKLLSLLLCS